LESKLPSIDSVFSVDCVIFGFDAGELKILLIERNEEPFKDWLALPGYFVEQNESIDNAAARILYELTGLNDLHMEQFHTFGELNRHPQGRVITVAYYALIRTSSKKELRPISPYAKKAFWHPVNDLPKLAFDHTKIFETGFSKIRRRLNTQPIAFELLPEKFTLTQLQSLYEAIENRKFDKRNFRKKMLGFGFLKELNEKEKDVSYRAAKLYRFDKRRYMKVLSDEGGIEN